MLIIKSEPKFSDEKKSETNINDKKNYSLVVSF